MWSWFPPLLAIAPLISNAPGDNAFHSYNNIDIIGLYLAPKLHPELHAFVSLGLPLPPVWIYFSDKPFTTSGGPDAAEHLTQKSLERRRLRRQVPGLLDHRDWPVPSHYLATVKLAGADLRTTSQWLNAVSARVPPETLAVIAALPHVRRIEPVRAMHPAAVPLERVEDVPPAAARDAFYGLAANQHAVINLPALHALGFTGRGMVIGVLDTGYRIDHVAFNHPQSPLLVRGAYDFINADPNVGIEEGDHADQHRHGTLILGTLAGYAPGDFVGAAFDAEFLLAKTEDVTQEAPLEEDWYVAGLQWLEAQGADVVTSSLGYIDWYTQADLDGLTAVTTIAVNLATANGVVCVTSAGNMGHDGEVSTLVAPGDAFEVLTVSAVNTAGATASFASKGPTADQRVKPEVLAHGVRTRSVNTNGTTEYVQASGTSLSAPQVAAVAALLLQAHPHWTVAQVREALITTASYYVAYGTYDPAYVRGYGIMDAYAAFARVLCTCDLNQDGRIDLTDALHLLDCYTGPGQAGDPVWLTPGACIAAFDLDRDGDIDLYDFAFFQFEFTGE